MTFNPLTLGMSDNSGVSPSRSIFYKEQGFLVIKSNGLPAPASGDITDVSEQDINYRVKYRAGTNTQSPENSQNLICGVLANGVSAKAIASSKQIPGTSITAPKDLLFNIPHFKKEFSVDSSGAISDNGVYTYLTGDFLSQTWDNARLINSNQYFRESDFESDHFRHSDGHSKILGFALDGYPIYGPYGYVTPTDSSNGSKLVSSGYVTLANDKHRPVSWKYDSEVSVDNETIKLVPGSFVNDYVYKNSKGDLDKFNGRFTKTPDFPNGTYAYFLTFTNNGDPAYPYIFGPETRQSKRLFEKEIKPEELGIKDLWSFSSGNRLTTLVERKKVNILLPVASIEGVTLTLISGSLPDGLRLEGRQIVGTVFEVAYNKSFTFVLRARYNDIFQDRTIEIAVTGPDSPEWKTNEGLLPVGSNDSLFVLDSEPVNYKLVATDSDIPAGDELLYFIAEGDGVLPPGIELTNDGKLQGVVEPLLSLDKRYRAGGYDNSPYGGLPIDYGVLSSSGFSTFYYDTQNYDYNEVTANPVKLNRYYPFTVTVTDGNSFVKREFKIYVVGDDYLKADNTIMQSSNGLFTADVSHVRTPTWITPRDLGFKRANNYVTIYLDVIDNPTLEGAITYTMESTNQDGTVSELPPGLELNSSSGEILGYIPYQPAITRDYTFTVRATRITANVGTVEVYATFYEDVMLGKSSFKVYKLDLTNSIDEVNDLLDLIGRDILVGKNLYTVTSVDDRNEEYDIIFVDQTLAPRISLRVARTAQEGQDHIMVLRLTEQEKEKYVNRTLRFSENESYTIDAITPYIEYHVKQADGSKLLPSNIPVDLEINRNYFVGDIIDYTVNSSSAIFKCNTPHSTEPELDEDGNLIIEEDGSIKVKFETEYWDQIATDVNELSNAEVIRATKQLLEYKFNYSAYVNVVNDSEWKIQVPSTARSRNIANMRELFNRDINQSEISVTLVRDNEDRLLLTSNLSRQLNQGRNIGLAIFKDDFFSENIVITSTDQTDIPSSTKTFNLSVIGEIDSNISWITPPDLGEINANYTSTLKVQAETTVPDSNMVYQHVGGKLPFGMSINLNGEILGQARQFANEDGPGLTTFDSKKVSWDGSNPGETSFDRVFEFTVKAVDRFKFAAIEQTFKLKVLDSDNTEYTSIFMRPMLSREERLLVKNFVSNPLIFEPNKIYRQGDPEFGVQENLDLLVYAGIESKEIKHFVSAAAKNHKRKRYVLGEFKTAVARDTDTAEIIYEVVYLEVNDPADADNGKTQSSFKINNTDAITVDSIQYSATDDNTKNNQGYDALPIYGRNGYIGFIIEHTDSITIQTRNSDVDVNTDNNNFDVTMRSVGDTEVTLELSDSEPYRIRPAPVNTIKSDSNAVKVSQQNDNIRYRSSIDHMRDNISNVGKNDRNFLPLWMRTPQDSLQELDYVTAIPICYCKPGYANDILLNIKRSGFDPSQITYDIDRYIIKETAEYRSPQYILFANYQYNV